MTDEFSGNADTGDAFENGANDRFAPHQPKPAQPQEMVEVAEAAATAQPGVTSEPSGAVQPSSAAESQAQATQQIPEGVRAETATPGMPPRGPSPIATANLGSPTPRPSLPSAIPTRTAIRETSPLPTSSLNQTRPYAADQFSTQGGTHTPPAVGGPGALPVPQTQMPAPQNPYGYSPTPHGWERNPQPAAGVQPAYPQRPPKAKRGPSWFALITAMVVTAILTSGILLGLNHVGLVSGNGMHSSTSTSSAPVPQSGQTLPPVTAGVAAPDWETVASTVRPATVSINVEGQDEAATGSGVVYDSSGYIVTNHHVVEPGLNGGTISVTTHDGKIYPATVVGTDQTTDLAVLQISGNAGLPAARFGTSANLKVGEPVMAIGSPLGLADTATTGIISAIDRPVSVQASTQANPSDPSMSVQPDVVVTNAIQVDASINPGNSGGPLFDQTGSVIGINSSIASNATADQTAGSIGLGFAIPVDLVRNVADQIIKTGSAQHALLGVSITSVSFDRGNNSGQLGAKVEEVVPGGAAEQAGIKPGDIIIGIDGRPVTSSQALTGFVRRYTAGTKVTLDIVRNGQDKQVVATLQVK